MENMYSEKKKKIQSFLLLNGSYISLSRYITFSHVNVAYVAQVYGSTTSSI